MSEAVVHLPAARAEVPSPAADTTSFGERIALIRPPCFWPALPGKPPLSLTERSGLIRLVETIPGACSAETMVAFMEALRHAPAGDIVEIGAGGGRSAALLVWLARRYQIGAVLCLDDWTDAALADFEIALAPLAEGGLNYGRDIAGYRQDLAVTTNVFGETRYAGRIALLHLAASAADLPSWLPAMAGGGWVVVSGARGASADGFPPPARDRVACSFTAGDALFVQLKR